MGQRHGRAAIDEHQALARRALVVVAEPDDERIVDERDRRIELVLAEPHERAPLVDRLAVEPGRGEALEDVGDGRRLEHDLVVTGRQLDRLGPGTGLGGGAGAEGGAVELGERERGVAGDTVGAVVVGRCPTGRTRRPRRSTSDRPSWRSAPVQWLVRQ